MTDHAIVCGSTTCPTCERPTTALIGPCDGCMESWERTGKFLRRMTHPRGEPVSTTTTRATGQEEASRGGEG